MRIFRQKTVEGFSLQGASTEDSTGFNRLTAARRLSDLKSLIDVDLSLLSRSADLLDPGKLSIAAEAIHPIAIKLRNTITQLNMATLLLDNLIGSLGGHTPVLSLEALQRLHASLDPATQKIITEAEAILKRLNSRIWETPKLDDFNFDEAIEILSRLEGSVDFIDLKKDILAELESWPSLSHINTLIKRLESIAAVQEGSHLEPASTHIHRLLLQLKKHLKRYSYSYSYSEITSSQSFERCYLSKDAKSLTDAAGEELTDSRGCYSIKPTQAEVERGLAEYNRTNRPSLRLYDETAGMARLCLTRTPGAEADTLETVTFAEKILSFCDGNKVFCDFICANLGIEPFMMITCENINTLRMDPKYIGFFPTDQYSISWHKLRDSSGVYYQHRLTAHCFHLTTTRGQIAVLKENSALTGDRELTEISAPDYQDMLTHQERLAPLFTTSTLSKIHLEYAHAEASSPNITLSVIEHTVTILTPEITSTRPSPSYGAASSSSSEEDLGNFKL